MKIRKAAAEDWSHILRLIHEYPEKLVQDHLPRRSAFFVATEDRKILGCCALEIYSKRLAEIRSLAVTKKHRGRGIATALIARCLAAAEKKGVYEVLSITGAAELFEKQGFGTFRGEKYALLKLLS